VEIHDGPILIDKNVFRNFAPTVERSAYAIGFYPNNSGQSSPLNTIGNNIFDDTVIVLSTMHLAAYVRCSIYFKR